MRHCIVNLGCKVNRVEADGFEAVLAACGSAPAPEAEADLIVVNTCTVTAEADKKARKAVRQALRANGHARVMATGCAAALQASFFEALDGRVSAVPKGAMEAALRQAAAEAASAGGGEGVLAQAAASAPVADDVRPAADAGPSVAPAAASSRTRVGIKVQDGCDNACTYCIVHVARGRAVSRPADEVVAEAQAAAARGVRELVLTGINLGSYHSDGAGLAALLERLLDATADLVELGGAPCRFRVSSVEPADVDDRLVEVLAAAEGRICRHLHLPLQSGSDEVLRQMARPYSASDYLRLVERLRERVPAIALATDVIVGFPGESEADFQATCDLARACGFMNMHVFPYSRRDGTPAAARPDQVPPQVKADRARRLRALASELRQADWARRAGTVELALVEEQGRAMTEAYYEVTAPDSAPVGALVSLTLG